MQPIVVFCVIFITVLVYSLISYKLKPLLSKLLMFFITLGIFFYSGIGIALDDVKNVYIVSYTIYLICLLVTLRLILDKRFVLSTEKKRPVYCKFDEIIGTNIGFIRFMTIVFFVTLLFNIYYLHNGFSTLSALAFSGKKIFVYRVNAQNDIAQKIFTLLYNLTLIYFCTYLNILAVQKKLLRGIMLLLLWVWLSFGQIGYISRTTMIVSFCFLVCFVILCKYGRIKITKKYALYIVGGLALSIPALIALTQIRIGVQVEKLTYLQALYKLVDTEFYYPIYYDFCITNSGILSITKYILWIILLPIPRVIFPIKPDIAINYSFTGMLTGFWDQLQSGYCIKLPSVLGESFLFFGGLLFWLHAVILGLITGIVFKFFLKLRYLTLWCCYICLTAATIGRGGTQGFIGLVINNSFALVIWLIYKKYYRFTLVGKGKHIHCTKEGIKNV